MILVFSDSSDYTTKSVIEWLDFYKQPFIRLNYDVVEDNIDILESDFEESILNTKLLIKGEIISLRDIQFIWYRRGGIRLRNFINANISNKERTLQESFEYYMSAYSDMKMEYLKFLFSSIPTLGFHNGSRINKLLVLQKAKEIGIKIPDTSLFTSKERMSGFLERKGILINKSMDLAFTHVNNKTSKAQMSYTNSVNKDSLSKIPNCFATSLFQKEIKKEFEIRTFFIGNKYYSMARMSQNNAKTNTDYRRYDTTNMNRVFPYILPIDIIEKLSRLMQSLCLKTGSIDLIFTPRGEYVFLEVNPAGQFGYLSMNCNYNLEKEIADYIITNKL